MAHVVDAFLQGAIAAMFGILAFLSDESLYAAIQADDMETMRFMELYFGAGITVIMLSYYTLFESSPLQATPGKLLLAIKVTDSFGDQIGPIRAAVRSWPIWIGGVFAMVDAATGNGGSALIANLLALAACVVVAFTAQKQGLHDMLVGTFIVRRGAEFQVSDAYAEAV
jgi:uncharacterized RDD family membrane protein YckC